MSLREWQGNPQVRENMQSVFTTSDKHLHLGCVKHSYKSRMQTNHSLTPVERREQTSREETGSWPRSTGQSTTLGLSEVQTKAATRCRLAPSRVAVRGCQQRSEALEPAGRDGARCRELRRPSNSRSPYGPGRPLRGMYLPQRDESMRTWARRFTSAQIPCNRRTQTQAWRSRGKRNPGLKGAEARPSLSGTCQL